MTPERKAELRRRAERCAANVGEPFEVHEGARLTELLDALDAAERERDELRDRIDAVLAPEKCGCDLEFGRCLGCRVEAAMRGGA